MEEGDRDSVGCPEEKAHPCLEGFRFGGRTVRPMGGSHDQEEGAFVASREVPEPYWRGTGCALETEGGLLWGATGIGAGRGP